MPQTAEDIQRLWPDLCLLLEQQGGAKPGLFEWLSEHPHILYLFYCGDDPAAYIRLDDVACDPTLGRSTVEIHGGALPEAIEAGLQQVAARLVMEIAFKLKKNIIAKVDPANLGAVGFCRKWGFKKINIERGKNVYRLTRKEWHERRRG